MNQMFSRQIARSERSETLRQTERAPRAQIAQVEEPRRQTAHACNSRVQRAQYDRRVRHEAQSH
jgi:hypothetical protein